MTIFVKPSERMRPLRKECNPVNAAIIGFLFGGIGLGLSTTSQAGLRYLSGALVAARWVDHRARPSNARLATATTPAS
jgi:hypothetical protein